MDVKQTVDNVSGIGVVNDIDQLSSIWDGTTVISDAAQLVDGLAKSDANRNQQISQAEAQIAAEQKQVQAKQAPVEQPKQQAATEQPKAAAAVAGA